MCRGIYISCWQNLFMYAHQRSLTKRFISCWRQWCEWMIAFIVSYWTQEKPSSTLGSGLSVNECMTADTQGYSCDCAWYHMAYDSSCIQVICIKVPDMKYSFIISTKKQREVHICTEYWRRTHCLKLLV